MNDQRQNKFGDMVSSGFVAPQGVFQAELMDRSDKRSVIDNLFEYIMIFDVR